MRVTLIIPPSGFLLDERVFPTLGVLKVAAVLERSGHAVDVLDLAGESDVIGRFSQHAAAHGPSDVYGLTATMPQMPIAATLARDIRGWTRTSRIILGGPHVTLMQASARQERANGIHGRACHAIDELATLCDVLVCGDGEHAIHLALQPDAPTIIDADDPKSPLFLTNEFLSESPVPARHLIDLRSYHYAIDGVLAQSLIAQLGCPFQCAFCGGRRSPFLRKIRTRSVDSIIAEMQHLYEGYGYRGFMFFDDELNVSRTFMDLLARVVLLQVDLGVTFRLRGFLKAELVTEAMATAMHAAGFRQVLIGVESGHPRILQNIRKQASETDNTTAVRMLQAAGIQVKAAMSIGHPGESAETIAATRRWLLTVRPDDFDVSVITVYPGTPYFDDAVETSPGVWTYTDRKTGDRLHARHVDQLTDVNFYKGVAGQYQAFVWTDALTSAEIVQARDALEAEVRSVLQIPYPTAAARDYEHSMGQR